MSHERRLGGHGHASVAVAVAVALLVAAWTAAPETHACQSPPVLVSAEIPCEAVPVRPVIERGEEARVRLSATNLALTEPLPPPFADDRQFSLGACLGPSCEGATHSPRLEPAGTLVRLDDAASPHADGATSWGQTFTALDADPRADVLSFSLSAADATRERACCVSACVQQVDDLAALEWPTAELVDPVGVGDAGGVLPFALRVHRNGYPADRVLTVQVEPLNRRDPADIFPLRPPRIATEGVELAPGESLVPFECDLHYPCYVGASNSYDVRLLDEAGTLLWSSAWFASQGMGVARVGRAPLARVEVLDTRSAGGGEGLSTCEAGVLDLRIYIRNPFFVVPLEEVSLEWPLPDGATLREGWTIHHHDNPLDDVDPSDAELAASADVRVEAGRLRVAVGEVLAREVAGAPPSIFRDLVEIDLTLDVPVSTLEAREELVLSTAQLEAISDGRPLEETTPEVRLPVRSVSPPPEVATTTDRLRVQPSILTWGASAADSGWTWRVHRQEIGRLGDDPMACLASALEEPRLADDAPVPNGGWAYLVSAANCAGAGPLGRDAAGRPREGEGCAP